MTANSDNPFGTEQSHTDYAGKNLVKLGLSGPLFKPPPGHTYLFRTPSLEKEWQDRFNRTESTPSLSDQPSPHATTGGTPAEPAGSATTGTGRVAALTQGDFLQGAEEKDSRTTAQTGGIPASSVPSDSSSRTERSSSLFHDTASGLRSSRAPVAETGRSANPADSGQSGIPVETGEGYPFPGLQDRHLQKIGDLLLRAVVRHRIPADGTTPSSRIARPMTPVPDTTGANGGFARTAYTPAAPQTTSVTGNRLPLNSGNPLCEPMAVRPVDWTGKRIRNRRYVTADVTRNLNTRLTLENLCRAIGINHEQVSQWEGGGYSYANVPWSPHHTGNHSGVTVASGLDLGCRNRQDLENLGLPRELVEKLSPYLHHRQEAAVAFLRAHPLVLTEAETDAIHQAVMYDMSKKAIDQWNRLVQRHRNRYPDAPYFHDLNSDQQTLLFSRFYHTGSFNRHPAFFEAVLGNDWNTALRILEEQAWQLSGRDATKWKGKRLKDEVEWYKKER